MFRNCKIHEQVKFPVFLVLLIVKNNDNVMAVTKRQITIGQYFFPRTAAFPDYGWNADAHSDAEPIYDEIILLPQENDQQQQQKQQQQQQNSVEPAKARLYPIPARIYHKNRFNSPRLNGTNAAHIAAPQDGAMTDVHIKMNADSSEDIHATIINETPVNGGAMPADRKYHYGGGRSGGYAGRVVIDLTNNDSTEEGAVKAARMSHGLVKSPKFLSEDPGRIPATANITSLPHAYVKQTNVRSLRSNTEIFNQILKVRKDIDGLRKDIRKIKQLLQRIDMVNGKLSGDKGITPEKKATERNETTDTANIRSQQQVFRDFSPESSMRSATAEPTYIVVSRTASSVNPAVRSRLKANARAPALIQQELYGWDVKYRNSTSNALDVEGGQTVSLERENDAASSTMETSRKRRPLRILPLRAQNLSNPDLAVDPKDTVKLSSVVHVTDGRGKASEEFFRSDLVEEARQKVTQVPTKTVLSEFFATAAPLSSEKETPNISIVTEAYHPLSTTRYTARSRINFGRQMRKLIIFTTTTSTPHRASQLAPDSSSPFRQISGNNVLPSQNTVTAKPTAAATTTTTTTTMVPSSIGDTLLLSWEGKDVPEDANPFNSTAVILGFASLTARPVRQDQDVAATATVQPRLLTSVNNVTTSSANTPTVVGVTTSRPSTHGTPQLSTGTTERNTRRDVVTNPPFLPLGPNFPGNNFDGIFVPWFNDQQLTLWPEGLFQRG